ncbi:hypothetical protein SeLEV6574_g06101 [Synchytrium endobioticum]|nr:hypothetical protein SeLEV6574_g06101 [Synchytrium endobioticum]
MSITSDTESVLTNPDVPVFNVAARTQLFTCVSCRVAFKSPEEQRDHHRTDWHRYNLKRKVADLPPVTAQGFADRVHAQQVKTREDETRQNATFECSICTKCYSTENAYTNHLQSKRHKELVLASGSTVHVPTVKLAPSSSDATASTTKACNDRQPPESSSDVTAMETYLPPQSEPDFQARLAKATTEAEVQAIWEAKVSSAPRLEESDCLFCFHKSADFESNMSHMTKAHSFFIPDMEYLPDISALIAYLAEKVSVHNICLYCNGRGRSFHSLEAVRKHMIDKGHTKIWYGHDDGGGEGVDVSEFYDFSSTWDDVDDEDAGWLDVEDEDASMGEGCDTVMEDGAGNDEGVNGESSSIITDNERTTMIYANARRLLRDSTKAGPKPYPDSYETNPELVLPSGRRAGHRSYNVYWKQSIPPTSPSSNKSVLQRLKQEYKLLGWNSANGNGVMGWDRKKMEAARKEVMARQAQARLQTRAYNDFKSRVGKIHNNQKHFRDANIYF